MNGPLDALDGFNGAFIILFVEHFHVFPFKRYLERQRQGGSRLRSFIVLSDCKVGGGPEMIPQTVLNR